MSVVEKLRILSEHLADGSITLAEFDRQRAALLDSVEPAEEAVPAGAAQDMPSRADAASDPRTTLALIALGSLLPGLTAMLFFGLPARSGATIFVAVLGALTWVWSRSLRETAKSERA